MSEQTSTVVAAAKVVASLEDKRAKCIQRGVDMVGGFSVVGRRAAQPAGRRGK